MLIDVSCFYKAFEKGIKGAITSIAIFGINMKGIGVNNNSRRYHQTPMYRKRAYFKALKNRRK